MQDDLSTPTDSDPRPPVPDSYPGVLQKACDDTWNYFAKLRSGEHIAFSWAVPDAPGWVSLYGVQLIAEDADEFQSPRTDWPWNERGLTAQVTDLVWIHEADT